MIQGRLGLFITHESCEEGRGTAQDVKPRCRRWCWGPSGEVMIVFCFTLKRKGEKKNERKNEETPDTQSRIKNSSENKSFARQDRRFFLHECTALHWTYRYRQKHPESDVFTARALISSLRQQNKSLKSLSEAACSGVSSHDAMLRVVS